MSAKSIVKQVLQPRRVCLHSTVKRRRIALAWATVLGGALLMPTAAAHAQRLRPRGRTTLGTTPIRRIGHRPVDPCRGNETPVADPGPAKAAEVGESVLFDGEASFDPDGTLQSYHWDFGDGTAADGKAVTHEYEAEGTYTVTLSVTDDCGAGSEEASATVEVTDPDPCAGNQPPVADAGADQTGETGQSLMFDGGASWDPDGDPDGSDLSYAWNFGDGQTGSGASVTHVYQAEGEYTVTLTVTDGCGSSSDAAAIVTVSEADPAELRADAGPDRSVRLGDELEFDGTASTGDIIAYQWEFGDGSFGSGPVKTHWYADTGTYTVTLTVLDSKFNQGTDTAEVTVTSTFEVIGFPELLDGDYTVGPSRGFDVYGNTIWAIALPDLLATVDVEDPAAPRVLNVQQFYGFPSDVAVGPRVAAFAADYGGIYLFDATDPLSQTLLGVYDTFEEDGFRAKGVALSGNLLYVVGSSGGLRILDISDPQSVNQVGVLGGIGVPSRVVVRGTWAYAINRNLLYVIDVSTPSAPALVVTERLMGTAKQLAVLGNNLAVAEKRETVGDIEGVEFFDVSDPTSPQWLSRIAAILVGEGVALGDGFAFVSTSGRVYKVNVSDPGEPTIIEWLSLDRGPGSVRFHEGMVYVGVQGEWLRIVRP